MKPLQNTPRHSVESRNPGFPSITWIPACAGMTKALEVVQ